MAALVIGPVLRHVAARTATIWVETDRPCTVEVLGAQERTFLACGHHYALVRVEGLAPGESVPYEVRLDGAVAWPEPGTTLPPATIRTLGDGVSRVSFGSCRYAPEAKAMGRKTMEPDALRAYAIRMMRQDPSTWPELFVLLGDQVYADEPSAVIQARIAARRGTASQPRGEVADFEEYSWLYQESWTDPEVRWLLATVPTAMIFDDHDVHDDWNTSRSWREDADRTPWWRTRVTGALMSYWVYQHLGNLSPDELDADPTYRKVRESAGSGEDTGPLLHDLAVAADREADGGKGYRWSFWRDLGRTRLVVLDSRCGRLLDNTREMIGPKELAWASDRASGTVDHLLIGTSLPWLMPPALHDLEAWDERLADRRWKPLARLGEKLRRAGDLEHWAAFRQSFEDLAELISRVAVGDGSTALASVCVLSGDVHHSYVCEATYPTSPPEAPVYQLTCSPLHNRVPAFMRLTFRVAWSKPVERAVRWLLGTLARVPRPGLRWRVLDGPLFGNAVSTLDVEGRRINLTVELIDPASDRRHPELRVALTRVLSR